MSKQQWEIEARESMDELVELEKEIGTVLPYTKGPWGSQEDSGSGQFP